jgi:hypothetical protein
MSPPPERLLRLSIAHYKKPNISDEAFHRWATEEHCVRAAAIHAKHGVRTFDMVSAFSGTLLSRVWVRQLPVMLGTAHVARLCKTKYASEIMVAPN